MIIFIFAILPTDVFAARNPKCELYTTQRQRIAEVMKPKESALSEQRIKSAYTIPQEQTNTAQKITTIRESSDKSRSEAYKKIAKKLKTKAEKEAFNTYQTTVESAITTYRTSLDMATATFNNDFLAVTKAHQTATDTALTTLKAQYDNLVPSTISFCDTNGTTKANDLFKNSIRDYEQNYAATPSISPRELEAKVVSLQTAKRQTDATAKKELETALKNAKNELQKTVKSSTKYIYD